MQVHSDAKSTDSKLDDIEGWIEDESKRIDHLHPKDAKANCDKIERELARCEEVIKAMFDDVQVRRIGRIKKCIIFFLKKIARMKRSVFLIVYWENNMFFQHDNSNTNTKSF